MHAQEEPRSYALTIARPPPPSRQDGRPRRNFFLPRSFSSGIARSLLPCSAHLSLRGARFLGTTLDQLQVYGAREGCKAIAREGFGSRERVSAWEKGTSDAATGQGGKQEQDGKGRSLQRQMRRARGLEGFTRSIRPQDLSNRSRTLVRCEAAWRQGPLNERGSNSRELPPRPATFSGQPSPQRLRAPSASSHHGPRSSRSQSPGRPVVAPSPCPRDPLVRRRARAGPLVL